MKMLLTLKVIIWEKLNTETRKKRTAVRKKAKLGLFGYDSAPELNA
jgi:hypothetical protein